MYWRIFLTLLDDTVHLCVLPCQSGPGTPWPDPSARRSVTRFTEFVRLWGWRILVVGVDGAVWCLLAHSCVVLSCTEHGYLGSLGQSWVTHQPSLGSAPSPHRLICILIGWFTETVSGGPGSGFSLTFGPFLKPWCDRRTGDLIPTVLYPKHQRINIFDNWIIIYMRRQQTRFPYSCYK